MGGSFFFFFLVSIIKVPPDICLRWFSPLRHVTCPELGLYNRKWLDVTHCHWSRLGSVKDDLVLSQGVRPNLTFVTGFCKFRHTSTVLIRGRGGAQNCVVT